MANPISHPELFGSAEPTSNIQAFSIYQLMQKLSDMKAVFEGWK